MKGKGYKKMKKVFKTHVRSFFTDDFHLLQLFAQSSRNTEIWVKVNILTLFLDAQSK